MKYLVVLKRFEIWLLIAVVGFLIVSAFQPEESEGEQNTNKTAETGSAVLVEEKRESVPASEEKDEENVDVFSVDRVALTPSDGGRIVELTLLARSTSGETVIMDDSVLKATTDTGDPVNWFFEPFRQPGSVDTDEPSLVTVRLWLESPAQSIWLDFQGERAKADLPR